MKTLLLATLALGATCLAQSTSATSSKTEPPHLRIDTVGPDGWRARLGPTNLGSLLASEQGRGLWQPQVLPLLAHWQQMVGDEAMAAEAQQRLLGHQGSIRIGAWFDPDRGAEVVALAVVLEGDGRTDMGKLAADLRQLQDRLVPGERRQQELGGAPVEVVTQGDDAMTTPLLEHGNVLFAMGSGTSLPSALANARALAQEATGKAPPPTAPALRLSLDLPVFLGKLLDGHDAEETAVMKALGVPSLGALSMTLGSAGPRVQFELAQQFTSDDRGLFAALLPATAGVPDAQALVPADAGSWKLGHFDFLALYRTIVRAVVAMEKSTAAELQAKMAKELGLDLDADLLAHTTDEVVFFHSTLLDLERPEDVTWTLAIGLRDRAAFDRGLTTLLAHAKPVLTRAATTTVDGIELHRYGTMIGYDVWFAVAQRHLFVSGGRDAEEQLTKAVTATKAVAGEGPTNTPAKAEAAFTELVRYLPPGCNGQARSEIDALVALPVQWWLLGIREVAPLPLPGDLGEGDDEEARQARRALLREHQLGVLRTATGYADRTWRWRTFW